tara:strand:- start:643 stop:1080 length:438 start_codon:yes stop_codon:yes gene_type:complete
VIAALNNAILLSEPTIVRMLKAAASKRQVRSSAGTGRTNLENEILDTAGNYEQASTKGDYEIRPDIGMISDNITLDKLLSDIDQQIEILTAMAQDNLILNEQLRLLNESRDFLIAQDLEISRMAQLIDEDRLDEMLSIVEKPSDD